MHFDASNRRVSISAIRLAGLFLLIAIVASSAVTARNVVAYDRDYAVKARLIHTF